MPIAEIPLPGDQRDLTGRGGAIKDDYLPNLRLHAAMVDRIESTKDLSKDDEAELTKAIEAYKKSAGY